MKLCSRRFPAFATAWSIVIIAADGALAAQTTPVDPRLSIDLTWLMAASGLVMMMQVGFLLLEAGMVRSKNSINVAQKNLLDFVFGVVAFAAIGFMLAFGKSQGLPFGWDGDFYFLRNLDPWQAGFFVFQVMFCGTAATIVSGAVAERMRLSAYVFGSVFLSALIYPIFAHWTWGAALGGENSAFLADWGFVDFAGSTVVHATGGWVALAACMVIGPRLDRFDADGSPIRIAGHNPVLSTTGAFLLFIGWIGFNGGSTLHAGAQIAPIILNTVLAGGMGACVGYIIGFYQDGVILPEKSNGGMLGGLVAVTAGCHLLEPGGALLIGAAGGAVALFGNAFVERRLKVDDAVGAIGIHAFAGVVGTLGLALLAPVENLPAGSRIDQLYIQTLGAGINFYWAFGLGFAFFWICDRTIRLRVTAKAEEDGLNAAEHATPMGIGHVEDAISDLLAGQADLTKRLTPVRGDESERLTRLFNRLMDSIEQDERGRGALLEMQRDQEEAERVAAFANTTFEAILIHVDGVLVDGNRQLEALVGSPLSDLAGRHLSELLETQAGVELKALTELNDDSAHELTLICSNGERVPVQVKGRDIVYRGRKARIGCIVDLRERKEAEHRIRFLALHDPLTALPNRTLFTERLESLVHWSDRGARCGVVLVDIDHFKDINDVHGHQAGDTVIRELAQRLRKLVTPTDVVARLGGDEFAVILTKAAFGNQLEDFAHRLLRAMREPIVVGQGEKVHVTVSIGSALCPDHAGHVDSLVGCADIALYRAKENGRNTACIYKHGMNELIEKRRALEADLDLGLERREFELYLQPRIETATATISGYEALLRWRHPEKGLIPPSDFIPVAEASGQIIALGRWVVLEACRILPSLGGLRISINVSPLQFRHSDFLSNMVETLRITKAPAHLIELEITESMLIDNDKRAVQTLKDLKQLGFSIALDDFGTGYSSLSYLSRYPFDSIKIDRSFVSFVDDSEKAQAIVQTIINLGTSLGMKIVAEGVERIEEAEFLCAAGCDELQGFLLGRPVPLDQRLTQIDPGLVPARGGEAGLAHRPLDRAAIANDRERRLAFQA
ncbi:ammonium transporter [Rhizobium sp. SSA_523]|uniref:ammonium transporter n=1 Tax=Rhizobium sp. SSA_523 TaxID=2952477 RepID=UPI002091968F|nr:ammonium transporter [Rhizobium sp. SSA_523]MCO5734008.1 ammonium transporter [Rhizobium sp. SSA_523]WKC24652.1 ammonium transporter [Rhizobium sp. SSA_523]